MHYDLSLRRTSLVAVAAFAISLAASDASAQATITVTSTTDTLVPGDGACSLREAISNANANADTTSGDCVAGSAWDTIMIPAGTYTLSIAGINENANMTGDLDITDETTVQGAGMAQTIVDGGRIDRVFNIRYENVHFADMTIQNGYAQQPGTCTANNPDDQRDGGGVYIDGWEVSRRFDRVRFTNNEAICSGGGLGAVNARDVGGFGSVVDNNLAQQDGGGVFFWRVDQNALPDVRLYSWTISGNTATVNGGGFVHTSGCCVMQLEGVTITGNTAGGMGGGVHQYGFGIDAAAMIIAGNTAGDPATNDCGGDVGLYYSVVGTNGSAGGCRTTEAGMRVGAGALGTIIDPTLTLIGTTMVHAIVDGGQAVDILPTGNPRGRCGVAGLNDMDVFGNARPFGPDCDAGAVESQVLPNQPPVAACQDPTLCAPDGSCVADVSIDDGSMDPDLDMLTLTPSPAGPYPLGPTTVTLSVSDGSETRMCMGTVTVNDCQVPSISLAADISVEADSGTGTPRSNATISTFLSAASAADVCDQSPSLTDDAPSMFPLGETLVTFTSRDTANNTTTAVGRVDVVDTVPPVTMITTAGGTGGGRPTSFTLSAMDSASGIAETRYQFDSDAAQVYSASVQVPASAMAVSFWSIDNAQNREMTQTMNLPAAPTPDSGVVVNPDSGVVVTPDSGVPGRVPTTIDVAGSTQPPARLVPPGAVVTMVRIQVNAGTVKATLQSLTANLGGTGDHAGLVARARVVHDVDGSGHFDGADRPLASVDIAAGAKTVTFDTSAVGELASGDGIFQLLVVYELRAAAPARTLLAPVPPAPGGPKPAHFAFVLILAGGVALLRRRWRVAVPSALIAIAVACTDDPLPTDQGTLVVSISEVSMVNGDGATLTFQGLPIAGPEITVDN